jgi:hypothetical protein
MMTTRPKKPATPTTKKFPRKAIPLVLNRGDSEEVAARKFSVLATSPELAAYRVIGAAEGANPIGKQLDVPTMLEQLREQSVAVNRGEMAQAEAMLINQASSLQALFVRLSERAMEQTQMPNLEGFMRLALRAQSQCRATLETLAAIKNPPIVYARQANVTTGPQQINNGAAAPTRAREIENVQSQLSRGTHELLPDTRASGNASRVNPALETLGEFDRAEVHRR